jgi:hypothetical protein
VGVNGSNPEDLLDRLDRRGVLAAKGHVHHEL